MEVNNKFGRKFMAILLVLIMVLAAVPMAAAETVPSVVYINDNIAFNKETGALYYTNGASAAGTLADNPEWNAYYNPSSGVLELRGYKGKGIWGGATKATSLTIKLIEDSTITTTYGHGINMSNNQVSLTITSDDYKQLTLNVSGYSEKKAYGIATARGSTPLPADIILKGKATVVANLTKDGAHAYGMFTGNGKVKILENASYKFRYTPAEQGGMLGGFMAQKVLL